MLIHLKPHNDNVMDGSNDITHIEINTKIDLLLNFAKVFCQDNLANIPNTIAKEPADNAAIKVNIRGFTKNEI